MEKEPVENIQEKKEIIKHGFRKEIINKLQNITIEILSEKINLIFLTDVSSTPFGWSLKEYFKLKSKNKFLDKKEILKFLRIDVSPIKSDSFFLIEYFSEENLEERKNIFNKHINLLKKRYSSNLEFNAEDRLFKRVEFAEELLLEIEKKIKEFIILLKQNEKIKIMIFDETFPNEIKKYGKSLEKYKSPLSDDAALQAKTIPLVNLFILMVFKKLKIDAEIYAGGVEIWDVPWTQGFSNFLGEERLNLDEADLKPEGNIFKPVLPIARYEEFETKSGKIIVPNPSEKAKIVPLENCDLPKKIISEMKEIGKEIYLNE